MDEYERFYSYTLSVSYTKSLPVLFTISSHNTSHANYTTSYLKGQETEKQTGPSKTKLKRKGSEGKCLLTPKDP